MIDHTSKLLLTLKERNEGTLVSKGKYETTNIKKDNGFVIKTIREPEYKIATKATVLSYEFIKQTLNMDKNGKSHRPEKPKGKHSYHRFKLWENWNQMGIETKLRVSCEIFANDQDCDLVGFEII